MKAEENKNGTQSVPRKSVEPRVLRKPNGGILIRVTINGERIVISPNVPPIPLSLWNDDDRRMKLKSFKYKGREFDGRTVNDTIQLYIDSIKRAAALHPKANKEKLLEVLELRQNDAGFYPKVFELITTWPELVAGTRAGKKTIWENLQEWFPNLTWESIDMHFYSALIKKLAELNYYQPGRFIKEIKAMCRMARDYDLPVSQDYLKKSFRVTWNDTDEDNDSDFLERDELDILFAIDDPIINGFLIACYAGGLRHSDWKKATPGNVQKGRLYLTQKKTKDYVILPIHSRVQQLWKRKLNYIDSQKTNRHLKAVIPLYIEGKKITTKSARKTFATLNYREGTPTHLLYKLTGHATEKQLCAYLKVKGEDVADIAAALKFFQS